MKGNELEKSVNIETNFSSAQNRSDLRFLGVQLIFS